MADRRPLLIGGEWTTGTADESIPVRSPATGETLAAVPVETATHGDRAVGAARAAQPRVAAMGVFERSDLLHRVASLILERRDAIALDLAREAGTPYHSDALVEVDVAAEMWRDAAEIIKRLEGEVL